MTTELNSQSGERPIKASYTLATLGSVSEQGGEVVNASTGMMIGDVRIAGEGDVVRYPDGSESRIVSGAGAAMDYADQPLAIIGSATDNGDVVVTSLQSAVQLHENVDGEAIPGLLQPGYTAPTETQA